MQRWRSCVVFTIIVVLSAGVIVRAPDQGNRPLPPAMAASHGFMPHIVHEAGPEAVAAYQAAIDHPTVLASVPCLCGCIQALGHTSNLACYIESSTQGATVYSTHGLYCLICQRITEDALAGVALGMNSAQLRAMIVEKYGG